MFGCACWPNLRPYNKHKLAFRSKECAFLGYSNLHKGFKCLDIASGRVYISRDVVFDENVLPFSKLHDNAGARLRAEILLLPLSLTNPLLGAGIVNDQVTNDAPANQFCEETSDLQAEETSRATGAYFTPDPRLLPRRSTSGSQLASASSAPPDPASAPTFVPAPRQSPPATEPPAAPGSTPPPPGAATCASVLGGPRPASPPTVTATPPH